MQVLCFLQLTSQLFDLLVLHFDGFVEKFVGLLELFQVPFLSDILKIHLISN